jgi:cell division protein FtsQ
LKEKVKIVFKWIGIGLSIALFIAVLVMAIIKKENKKCLKVITKVDYESGNNFIAEDEVNKIILEKYSNRLIGEKIKDIKTQDIEHEIRKNRYVKDVQIYSNFNDEVVVKVTQKEALARIINNTGVSYYLTNIGDTIPLSTKFTSRVLVVQGDVKKNEIPNVIKLCNYINHDEFWKAAVEQVYIGTNGDYEIYTKLGDQNVVLGKIDDDLENKFKKLKSVYTELIQKIDFDKYKTINLKYKGQVVCSKI